mmetsp:Transcript_20415/g.44218  ORF Transcript_20415/g.44218 Transcript_20415/m.44218 type:complete len:544 (-) Transcript_20415:70-1701(-)
MKQHILEKARHYGARTAIRSQGRQVSYDELCAKAARLSQVLLLRNNLFSESLNGQRVAYLLERSPSYVVTQWATWASGGIAVPLHPGLPTAELQYMIETSGASQIVTNQQHLTAVEEACPQLPVELIEEVDVDYSSSSSSPSSSYVSLDDLNPGNFAADKPAQILFTSGTTGRAKGVVATHQNITTQINDIIQAWEITPEDSILHFLPLHHVHGIINKLLVPLYAGGSVNMLPNSRPELIWKHVRDHTTILMAVPTIYANLLEWYHQQSPHEQAVARENIQKLRLCVSGSMSCPLPILHEWEKITGHSLLERYGMTELGMVLTNPLHGTRHAGYVGQPFPSVRVKLGKSTTPSESDEDDKTTTTIATNPNQGELLVKGDTVFDSYWNRPDATRDAFDADGWFRTGDWVEYCPAKHSYKILGRMSSDILKVGGYKISAVEIEATVLEVDDCVAECFVVGAPDAKWGQTIVAVVRLKNQAARNDDDETTKSQVEQDAQHSILNYVTSKLAKYKIPRKFVFLDTIPKNAMGKVNKKKLLAELQHRL